MIRKILLLLLFCWVPVFGMAENFSQTSSYDVCFTPGQDCAGMLVAAIHQEKERMLVQAYSFTSAPIAQALVDAKRRGVEVKVILDKSQFKAERYSSAKFLNNQGIPVWIDSKPAIAHNKIFIFGRHSISTGSFNFTKVAQEKNAENLLIIHDAGLAAQYERNWLKRLADSVPFSEYQPKRKPKKYIF